jgi:hypothetical protein
MPPAVAALEAMARTATLQPNEWMARFAPRRNDTISLDQSCRQNSRARFFGLRFEIVLEGLNWFHKNGWGSAVQENQ